MAEEKLDRHTDPSGLLASARAADGGRPYLGSIVDVERLLREFASDVITRFDEVGQGVLTPADASGADTAACLHLGGVFAGRAPGFTPLDGWNGKALADHLREQMVTALQPEDDDAKLIAQALAVFAHQIYDLLREASAGAKDEDLQQSLEASVRSMAFALLGVVGND